MRRCAALTLVACVASASSGKIWLPKLRSMKISDLAEVFSGRYGKPIELIGIRPGEKLHEELISEAESVRATFDGKYCRMVPAHTVVTDDPNIFSHKSNEDLYERNELAKYLDSLRIFERNLDEFVGREIEEIFAPFDQNEVQ